MVQGVTGHHSAISHGTGPVLLPWQPHFDNAVEYTGPGGNNAPRHASFWQQTKHHVQDMLLGALLGGGFGALFHRKFPDLGGGFAKVLGSGAALGAGLSAIGAKEWVINTLKLPYTIWHGLRHKHEINPAHKRNPFLPDAMMDMQNEDIFHYMGKNPMLPDKGFLSADIFDQRRVNSTYGGL